MKKINPKYRFLSEHKLYLDFDGVLSGSMFYSANEGKNIKQAQYGARHALEILSAFGCEINVITGDSSTTGVAIARSICAKMPIDNFLSVPNIEKLGAIIEENKTLDNVFYVAEDLYDSFNANYVKTIVPSTTHSSIKLNAFAISKYSAIDYFAIDFASIIVENYLTNKLFGDTRLTSETWKNKIWNNLISIITTNHLLDSKYSATLKKKLALGSKIATTLTPKAFINTIHSPVSDTLYIKDLFVCS